MPEVKLIFSPQVARYLLRSNFQIIDIKPDREDKSRTIFIFKYNDDLIKAIKSYKEKV